MNFFCRLARFCIFIGTALLESSHALQCSFCTGMKIKENEAYVAFAQHFSGEKQKDTMQFDFFLG
jgi:hypothetical protein